MRGELAAPKIVDRSTIHAELDTSRVQEGAHTEEGNAMAAALRPLPMVEAGATPLIGERSAVTLASIRAPTRGTTLNVTVLSAKT